MKRYLGFISDFVWINISSPIWVFVPVKEQNPFFLYRNDSDYVERQNSKKEQGRKKSKKIQKDQTLNQHENKELRKGRIEEYVVWDDGNEIIKCFVNDIGEYAISTSNDNQVRHCVRIMLYGKAPPQKIMESISRCFYTLYISEPTDKEQQFVQYMLQQDSVSDEHNLHNLYRFCRIFFVPDWSFWNDCVIDDMAKYVVDVSQNNSDFVTIAMYETIGRIVSQRYTTTMVQQH